MWRGRLEYKAGVFYSEDSGELPGLTVLLLSSSDRIEAPDTICQAISYTTASP